MNNKRTKRKQLFKAITKQAFAPGKALPNAQDIVDSSVLTEESKAYAHDIFQKLLADLRTKLITDD